MANNWTSRNPALKRYTHYPDYNLYVQVRVLYNSLSKSIHSFFQQLSKFLQTMEQQHSLVRVKELTKGVESIVEVDWKNPEWAKSCFNLKKSLGRNPPTFSLSNPCASPFCTTSTLPRLRSFSVPEEKVGGGEEEEEEAPYHPPEITTLYSVPARLEPLFLDTNKR